MGLSLLSGGKDSYYLGLGVDNTLKNLMNIENHKSF
jgi:diphthamide synthase (EF-2-diphthine--ammonia ligase)